MLQFAGKTQRESAQQKTFKRAKIIAWARMQSPLLPDNRQRSMSLETSKSSVLHQQESLL